ISALRDHDAPGAGAAPQRGETLGRGRAATRASFRTLDWGTTEPRHWTRTPRTTAGRDERSTVTTISTSAPVLASRPLLVMMNTLDRTVMRSYRFASCVRPTPGTFLRSTIEAKPLGLELRSAKMPSAMEASMLGSIWKTSAGQVLMFSLPGVRPNTPLAVDAPIVHSSSNLASWSSESDSTRRCGVPGAAG